MIYVLAYPQFKSNTAQVLERFRAKHEPERAKMVPPHITLAFALRDIDLDLFFDHCQKICASVQPFQITFNQQAVVWDPYENTHKLFLWVGAGAAKLNNLHRRIYDDPNVPAACMDGTFRPHMTIGTNADQKALEGLDAAILSHFPIPARQNGLDVVGLLDGTVTPLRHYSFGRG
ncbi:2'-5' RNA ligase family protein [Algirhabdus cladophorae]|uniref:2'-5' RNA ligase family protein n=1 Tax=Algirhabdus cladophorae TaxID=3377108 RepID=UPI003B845695